MAGSPLTGKGAVLASEAISFGISCAVGFVLGHWLDGWLGTTPALTLILGILGVVGAFMHLLRTLKMVEREEKGDDGPSGKG